MEKSKNAISQPDEFDVAIESCSSMDCTGLIPALPGTEAEKEAYEDLYPYITHAADGGQNE